MAFIPILSIESATTSNPAPPSCACKRSRVGISARQGTHQVAHRFSRTTLPWKSASRSGLPAASWKLRSGTGFGAA